MKRCNHPWSRLIFIYSGDGSLVERIGCVKCNKELFPKKYSTKEDQKK